MDESGWPLAENRASSSSDKRLGVPSHGPITAAWDCARSRHRRIPLSNCRKHWRRRNRTSAPAYSARLVAPILVEIGSHIGAPIGATQTITGPAVSVAVTIQRTSGSATTASGGTTASLTNHGGHAEVLRRRTLKKMARNGIGRYGPVR